MRVKRDDVFIAITDPGSKMQEIAESDGFRSIYYGEPTIGGRYSALSNFGRVPAALMGLDASKFVDRAQPMVRACSSSVPANQNPGVILGAILGALAKKGRDKVTMIASPEISGIGTWLEQLLAESTGKNGKGLIPVDGERVGPARVYGDDRLFIYLRFDSTGDREQEQAVRNLERSGQPVVRISMADLYNLSQEVFRWEMATTVAGSNPGDQSLRSARRRSQQDCNPRFDPPIREGRFFPNGDRFLHRKAGFPCLPMRKIAASCGGRPNPAPLWHPFSRLTSTDSPPATISPSWPTSG